MSEDNKCRIQLPNPDNLTAEQARDRGLERLKAAWAEAPELAVLMVGDTVSMLRPMARAAGMPDTNSPNPYGVLVGIGVIGERYWPEGLDAAREALAAWNAQGL